MDRRLYCGRFELSLERPQVMGIVNVTPDSFSDGGQHADTQAAVAHAYRLIEQGADLLDIGGESTRPGADPVDARTEAARVVPVVQALRDAGVPLSVDTFKPEVMRAVLDAGADMINDIWGLRLPGAIEAVATSRCAVCVMHMQGDPQTMQDAPNYDDVVDEVRHFLHERETQLRAAGVDAHRLVMDPGFGFGKSVAQNYRLLDQLASLSELPVLVGMSRKSMVGHVTGRAVTDRLAGSLAAALAAVARGAAIVRVHDVAETVDALKVWAQVQAQGKEYA